MDHGVAQALRAASRDGVRFWLDGSRLEIVAPPTASHWNTTLRLLAPEVVKVLSCPDSGPTVWDSTTHTTPQSHTLEEVLPHTRHGEIGPYVSEKTECVFNKPHTCIPTRVHRHSTPPAQADDTETRSPNSECVDHTPHDRPSSVKNDDLEPGLCGIGMDECVYRYHTLGLEPPSIDPDELNGGYTVVRVSPRQMLKHDAAQHINPAYLAGQLGVTQAELVELLRTRWSGRPVSRDLHAGTDDAKVGCTGTGGPVELLRSITHNWYAEVHLARTTGMSVGWDDPRYR